MMKHNRYEVTPLATVTVAAAAVVVAVVTVAAAVVVVAATVVVVVIVATDDLCRITLCRRDFTFARLLTPNCNYYMPGTNICP